MADVAHHHTTHRARGLGGTDPVPPDMPSIILALGTQSVTANAEAQWTSAFTTDPDTFMWDPSDPAAAVIQRGGMYEFRTTIQTTASSPPRAIAIATGAFPGSPFSGSAIVDASTRFWSGDVVVSAATHAVLPTFNLWECCVRQYAATPSNKLRVVVHIDHQGTNFTLTSSVLIITKLHQNININAPDPTP